MLESIAGSDPLLTVRHLVEVGGDDRSARRAHDAGRLLRVRRGAYANSVDWQERGQGEKYDLRIAAVIATRRSEVVLSHQSAARVWGLPLITPWPGTVHLTEPIESHRRSKNGVSIHRVPLAGSSVERRNGILVTSLARTLVDLARDGSFRDAVTAMDFALSAPGGRMPREFMLTELERYALKGSERALRAVEFASELSMSPLESLSRVVLAELRFPAPELQKSVRTRGGVRLFDFWWPDVRVAGECDGRIKYSGEQYAGSRAPEEVVWAEKLRENEFMDSGIRFVRWTWRDCFEPERLATRLRVAGLRQSPAAPRVLRS